MYIHKLLKNIPQKHLQYFPRYFTHFFLNSSSFFWLWIWYLTTITNISGIRLQSNRGFVDTGRTSKFSHLLCTTFEVPIVREQGWAIWRGKHPNLRNKRDKTLKNLTCLHDFNILYKKLGYLLQGRGSLQVENTHPVTVIGTTLSDKW